ncbi:hypothetical protein DV515_00012428 [Chloebia gouldiae]|uniref:Probable U3 small nucleolar RNA-associated protein 11 n=1 Tax=Chloebia gouldiae TaxID=44316 RepID=A0A3L8S3N5_CHLGU|nr:hypothetical protein DV515_00012428 [Chloebia gouldiae]
MQHISLSVETVTRTNVGYRPASADCTTLTGEKQEKRKEEKEERDVVFKCNSNSVPMWIPDRNVSGGALILLRIWPNLDFLSQKIERLKAELHLLDAAGSSARRHLFFVDTEREVKEFDIAAHLDTLPELVDRVYNRPTIATLQREAVKGPTDPVHLKKLAQQRKNQYDLLRQRIEREKAMFAISQKIQTRKDLLDKTHKVKVKKETTTSPAIYKFKFQRKR